MVGGPRCARYETLVLALAAGIWSVVLDINFLVFSKTGVFKSGPSSLGVLLRACAHASALLRPARERVSKRSQHLHCIDEAVAGSAICPRVRWKGAASDCSMCRGSAGSRPPAQKRVRFWDKRTPGVFLHNHPAARRAYVKVRRRQDRAIVGAATFVTCRNGVVEDRALALTSMGWAPFRARAGERRSTSARFGRSGRRRLGKVPSPPSDHVRDDAASR